MPILGEGSSGPLSLGGAPGVICKGRSKTTALVDSQTPAQGQLVSLTSICPSFDASESCGVELAQISDFGSRQPWV